MYDKCSDCEYKDVENLRLENQELKKRLEKKYEKVGTLTAEILYEENTRLVNEITVLKTENQELKKRLEEKIILEMKLKNKLEEQRKEYQETYKDVREEIKEYKNRQQKFMEYLENCINKTDYEVNVLGNYKYLAWANAYRNTLTKYKEIIGVKE